MHTRHTSPSHSRSFFFILLFIATLPLAAQKKDTLWLGYDKGKADSLITWDGRYIGTSYAHDIAGWTYALRMDLTDFGTKVSTIDFYPVAMSFNVFPSESPSGIVTRNMTATIWQDSSGLPGKPLVTVPFSIVHRPGAVLKETVIVLDLKPFTTTLSKKNPLWFGFEEGPTTTTKYFTWMRSCYLQGTKTKSYDRSSPTGVWTPIDQPVFWQPPLRDAYNLFFRMQYIGDGPIGVEPEKQPATLSLAQNYPNPAASRTMISYTARNDAPVSLIVFDMLGREIATLVRGEMSTGENVISFDASHLAAGCYRVVLSSGRDRVARTMIVAR